MSIKINTGYFELDVIAHNRPFHWRALYDEDSSMWQWGVSCGEYEKRGVCADYTALLRESSTAMKFLSEISAPSRLQ